MSNQDIKSRRYCFTIHNYTKKDLVRFGDLALSLVHHRYICYGLEIAPETKTEHIQGYIELNQAQRLTYLQNYFNFMKNGKLLKFHIEIANGTAEQNKKYASKEGNFFEYGEPSTQGDRTDLKKIKEAVKNSPQNITTIVDEHVMNNQQLRFAEGLRPYYLLRRDPNTPPKVFWIFGPTGIGKTSLVYKSFTDICSVSSYDWLGTGYNQNECFLLDDFREFSLPFELLLKIADRYPLDLFYKGGQVPLNSPYIVVTSPHSIDNTFKNTKENLQQLHRRVTQINMEYVSSDTVIDLKNLDEKHIWNNVNDYSSDF